MHNCLKSGTYVLNYDCYKTAQFKPSFKRNKSYVLVVALCFITFSLLVNAQNIRPDASHHQRQQEYEQTLRQEQNLPDVHLQPSSVLQSKVIPSETPCFVINNVMLQGQDADKFNWALRAVNLAFDPALERCLGINGINIVINRIQNAIIERGFITTRVLASDQDLTSGNLRLNIIAGHIREVYFASGTAKRATMFNAVPIKRGDLLNLRDIEQALENFRRLPTVESNIQITPSADINAKPGDSDLVISWKQRNLPMRFNFSLDMLNMLSLEEDDNSSNNPQGNLKVSVDNPFMLNDLLYVNLNSNKLNYEPNYVTQDYFAHYSVPYNYFLFGLNLSENKYHQKISSGYQKYVYKGVSNNFDAQVSHLIYRNNRHKIGAYVGIWHKKSRNFIEDTEILVQHRRTSGFEAGFTHKAFFKQAVLESKLGLKRGTGAFNALRAFEEDSHEKTSRLQIITLDTQFSLPFTFDIQGYEAQNLRYSTNLRTQIAQNPLSTQEYFSIGGRYSVRGFDGGSRLASDSGVFLRNELALEAGPGYELYVALDAGHVKSKSVNYLSARNLVGFLSGFRSSFPNIGWDFFIGAPIYKPQDFTAGDLILGFSADLYY